MAVVRSQSPRRNKSLPALTTGDSNSPDWDSSKRIKQRQGFFLSFFGKSTAKRVSLLFVVLNVFAFLNYVNLMTKTQLVIANETQKMEFILGGYQFHNASSNLGTTNNILDKKSKRNNLQTIGTSHTSKRANFETAINKTTTNVPLENPTPGQQQNNQSNYSNSMTKESSNSKFAYVFLIGGALSNKKGTDHRGALYSVVVAAHNLWRHGSKADIVLMVQVSATTNATALPPLEEELLRAMNIRVLYLPKALHYTLESFYTLMMEKFRILQLEEYSRVLYLDADTLPMCNLDYLMELSHEGELLRENVVIAYKGEPASGGFFVLEPNATDYEQIVDIILKTEKKTLERDYPHWDPVEGWGHVMDESDPWKASNPKKGTNWTFYGAQADQGLLYYWTKFYKKSVSIINNNNVEQWGKELETGNLRLISLDVDTLEDKICSSFDRERWKAKTPYRNYLHFTGRGKPWYKNRTDLENSIEQKENYTTFDYYTHQEYWFWLLRDALQTTDLRDKISLDFITNEIKQPSLGKTPSFDQRAQYIRNKAKHSWKQYQYESEEIGSNSFNKKGGKNSSDIESVNEVTTPRKWAYAFLLGGARSMRANTKYIAGLYSIVVAAQQLRKLGSVADIVLMVQIAADSPHEKLSEFEEELLHRMKIKIVYIPKFASLEFECFYSLMMEKFRILKLTEYSRVMYLDYDVLPTCNLDYMFELSDPLQDTSESFRLKENVILSYQSEPSSGGMFILKPNVTDYDHIQRIIREKETRSMQLPYPHWDESYGWGHVITPPDHWKTVRGRIGKDWSWYGVMADQGLLYYWTKYVKKKQFRS